MPGELLAIAWKEKPRQPMVLAQAATISVDKGLAGDSRGAIEGRQVTIVFAEDWAAACADLGAEPDWTARRANLLVRGLANPRAPGGVVRIGDVRLEITEETEPCSVMDKQMKGLRKALKPDWRAGVSTRVLSGGAIRVGDAVSLED